MIADGFSPIADAFRALLFVFVFVIVIVTFTAAVAGAKEGPAAQRGPSAIYFGCLVGATVAMITGWLLLDFADSFAGLVLGPLIGGATAYGAACVTTSGTSRSTDQKATDSSLDDR